MAMLIAGSDVSGIEKISEHRVIAIIFGEEENLKAFSKFKFIRSSEIVYAAYKKGIIKIKGKKALEALLYATKFKGAAISFEEIDILKRL